MHIFVDLYVCLALVINILKYKDGLILASVLILRKLAREATLFGYTLEIQNKPIIAL